MKKFVASILLILMSGCATSHQWYKDGVSPEVTAHDQAECAYQAKAATVGINSARGTEETQRMGSAVGDGIVIAEKRVELTNDCMKLKGYSPR
ncbi:hypothetical protein N5B55_05895 [Ralstonia pickettii]|uniref:hypothetical protein n=1 Tax=Ralstonia pickettii TaxID=329 RepID=UPI002715205B|nr:hypothetical protein [Ralstonia pickettii]WKZ86480.1 hypothetical protein N5B55_05895 [Ralstonia pickettii]